MFPLALSSGVLLILHIFLRLVIVDLLLVGLAFVWSTRASVVFIGQFVEDDRKALAVFPVFFFYSFLSWIILI